MKPTPEDRILKSIQRAEASARSNAASLTATPTPINPHHYHACLYCTKPGQERGSGLARIRAQYWRADNEMIAEATSVTLCPACNGYGIQITQLGKEYAEQERKARRAA